MKHIHFLLTILFATMYIPNCASQPEGQNYIRTRIMLNEEGSQYIETIQYYDGLGRPFLNVQKGITPNHNNLATLLEYDAAGREAKTWLPTATASDYITPQLYKSTISASYNGDSRPYKESVYETSPLSRPVKQYGAGADWADFPVATNYMTNTATGELSCKFYSLNSSEELIQNGNYNAGELYVTKVTDEEHHIFYTFTDKLGQLLLSRQMGSSTPHDTYYVYDDFGNRRFVLPPAYQDEPIISLYAYQYKYDNRNRCIEKTLPGCEPIVHIYDLADNLILSQTGEERKEAKWTFYLYDKFHRLTVKGTCNNHNSYRVISGVRVTCSLNRDIAGMIIPGGLAGSGYSSNVHFTSPVIQEVNYYDNYAFLSLEGYKNKSQFQDSEISAVGLQTGHITNLLNTNTYLHSATYYDAKGKPVKVVSDNHLGGYNTELTDYTYTGKLKREIDVQTTSGKERLNQCYIYNYDHAERLVLTKYQLNGAPSIKITENTYNELGRLESRKFHQNDILKSNYTYNIRGWLTGISGQKFSQTLCYNEDVEGRYTQHNGNICYMSWRAGDETIIREYDFHYDEMNRIYCALYTQSNGLEHAYNTCYHYNKMGSITTLERLGVHSTADNNFYYNTIDYLDLSYNGNQLKKVTDSSPHIPLYNGALDYVDGTDTEKEFDYDGNGNLIQDLDKGISQIQYNILNLPEKVTFASGKYTNYHYDANGTKYRVVHVNPATFEEMPLTGITGSLLSGALLPVDRKNQVLSALSDTLTTDYCGNVIYENGKLDKILIQNGYITLSGTVPTYHYYLRDHQGNNRVVTNQNGTVEEVNHFYPFGGLFGESVGINRQPYKYGGKELDRMHGLDWADFGGRFMRFDIPGWMSIDPMCEKYYSINPYVYCMNNPVNAVDPGGKLVIFVNGMHNGFEGARPAYWSMERKKPTDFNTAVMAHFEDWNDKYYDGALCGGLIGLLNGNSSPFKRSEFGHLTGEIDASSIVSGLARNDKGEITETIKVITHSMGAAYAKGFVGALVEYAKKNPGQCNGLSITEYDFAPFQPTSQRAVEGVQTFQYSHRDDKWADYAKIPGAEFMDTCSDKEQGHSISSFYEQIMLLFEGKIFFRNGMFIKADQN